MYIPFSCVRACVRARARVRVRVRVCMGLFLVGCVVLCFSCGLGAKPAKIRGDETHNESIIV